AARAIGSLLLTIPTLLLVTASLLIVCDLQQRRDKLPLVVLVLLVVNHHACLGTLGRNTGNPWRNLCRDATSQTVPRNCGSRTGASPPAPPRPSSQRIRASTDAVPISLIVLRVASVIKNVGVDLRSYLSATK